ncbi:hypothetical protein ABPG72_016606 [Tetrahymena utriculariae]
MQQSIFLSSKKLFALILNNETNYAFSAISISKLFKRILKTPIYYLMFSFESDNDIIKLVLKLDSDFPSTLLQKVENLPQFKSKQLLQDDLIYFFQDNFKKFLQRDPSDMIEIRKQIYELDRQNNKAERLNELNLSGYRTGAHNQELTNYIQRLFNGEKVELKTKRIVLSLIQGLTILMKHEKPFYHFNTIVPLTELEKFNYEVNMEKTFVNAQEKGFPFIFVKIRSGISFYKVTGPGEYKRITGSIMGESFVESVMLKLTSFKDINEGFKIAFQKGDNKNCDMTVEDIYGAGCINLGIPKDILASSFGKCSREGPTSKYNEIDIIKSLLIAITINTGQLIGLYSQLEKVKNIVISSWKIKSEEFNFILQSTAAFYSKNECIVDFIKDSDYLSCIGDLL